MEILSAVSILSLLLCGGYIAILYNFMAGWLKLHVFLPSGDGWTTTISIIVAARNEEENIGNTLNAILAQNYPSHLYEIIVVNDHSTDRTAEIVSAYAGRGVRLIDFNDEQTINSFKKAAIAAAIQQATGELIVTTDADCTMGPAWLTFIASFYEQKNFRMISSPVSYYKERTFFERLQSLEFLFLIGLGAAGIGNKRPTTCNGANLAYQKQAFNDVEGFKGIDDLASGDDELLLHKIAERYPGGIGFLKNKDAMVFTEAKPTLKEFISQRKRWASKSTRYKNKGIIFLGIAIWAFNLGIVANVVAGFLNMDYLRIAGLQLLLKITVELIFLYRVTSFAGRQKLLALTPILSILHVVYLVFIGFAGNSGTYTWKGRKVN